MLYSVQQLAKLANVSVRTLHYYDEIGLLIPARVKNNGYRSYGETELLRLQQILFFRELDFPLGEIQKILSSPNFDMRAALKEQKKLIELKQKRLGKLLDTIDKTIKKINKQKIMKDEELYGGFTKEEMEKYSKEAKDRWGGTDAWRQSEERVKKMGREGINKAMAEGGKITVAIADCMKEGIAPKSDMVQKLIAEHYNWLRNFYEPNPEIYRGLAEMYVADDRFKANYEKVAPGLAEYMQKGMLVFLEKIK